MKNVALVAILVFVFGLLVFAFANTGFAQNADVAENRDVRKLYEQATDEQIKEAQVFYRRCTKNDLMSSRQDCKCAATEYIATRIELGAEASASEIMAINANTCLRQDAFSQSIDNRAPDFSNVTDEQIEEAQSVYKYCEADYNYRSNYDCECLAAKYLDARVENGPILDRSTLITQVRGSCPNVVEKVGQQYSQCMSPMNDLEIFMLVTQKEYCECYAREWTRNYNAVGGIPDTNMRSSINYRSSRYCQNPGVYGVRGTN